MYRLGHEVWGEWSYDGRDMIISSNDVIPFPRGDGECNPQPTERMVHHDQRSIVILLMMEEKTYNKGGIQEESSVMRNI